jgi:hypothetical protein
LHRPLGSRGVHDYPRFRFQFQQCVTIIRRGISREGHFFLDDLVKCECSAGECGERSLTHFVEAAEEIQLTLSFVAWVEIPRTDALNDLELARFMRLFMIVVPFRLLEANTR